MAKQTASSPHRNVRKRPGNTHAARSPRSRSAPWDDAYGVPVPRGLHEAIEVERDNLSKAHSLLGCLALSMEAEPDPVSGPYYPDIARLARDMVKQSINGLDSLTLQRILERDKVKEDSWVRDHARRLVPIRTALPRRRVFAAHAAAVRAYVLHARTYVAGSCGSARSARSTSSDCA